ncbi:hypothetical protein [Marinomonas sp. 2405UD68-3]|uniref:hypothetical protein n=1 Tax=Marinomonas sp. 2405UD68-3 TaxID=3391835 RepID=UPI0039C9F238
MKNYFLISTIVILVSACDSQEKIEMKWSYGKSDGWFPLTHSDQNLYVNGTQAFINDASMIVNCRGRGIKHDKSLPFLSNDNSVILYNTEIKKIIERHKPWILFEYKTGATIREKESILINQSKRGTGDEAKDQCNETQHRLIRGYL